jgi:predicted nucleic acid-binding protein
MYLLDTNVVSNLRRRDRADRNVLAWISRHRPEELFLSAISVLEIEIGARLIERKDRPQGAVYRTWVDEKVLPGFEGRILAFDLEVALRCAPLHVPDPRPERDAIIAATALVHGFTVVTRNTKDFEPTGVQLINPWLPVG